MGILLTFPAWLHPSSYCLSVPEDWHCGVLFWDCWGQFLCLLWELTHWQRWTEGNNRAASSCHPRLPWDCQLAHRERVPIVHSGWEGVFVGVIIVNTAQCWTYSTWILLNWKEGRKQQGNWHQSNQANHYALKLFLHWNNDWLIDWF